MIIGITGTLGAGKGTVVEILKEMGFVHYSVRDFLVEEIGKRGMEVSQGNMFLVANDLRSRYGSSYIVEELYRKALLSGGDFVIESVRCVGEVEALKGKKDFVLWAVDADVESRYERVINRSSSSEEERNFNFQTFVQREQDQMMNTDPSKQNLKACIEMSDYVFRNDWTVAELRGKVLKELDRVGFAGKLKDSKRKDVLSWDEYFMAVAALSAKRSKDPSTQVGACIVDSNKKIVGVGYNGFPTGCSDDELPWAREGDFLDVKYSYVCHAELNAILNSSGKNLAGTSIYVDLFPCNECAKAIIQSGIREVVYLSDKYADLDMTKASKKMLGMAGVKMRQLFMKIDSVCLDFKVD